MATFIEDLGIVSAYGEAVRKGYTGTEEEFAEMLANLPDKLAEAREYAASAAESSASAASSADGVQRNASIASTAASDAQSAAASALQSATFAETTVEGIEEHEEQCRIYRAEAVAAAEELKTTTLWNDALIDETVTGKIASFSDGCVGMPMKSIVAEITPVQSGSGDPSPDNICPISGRTGMTVTRTGKNICPVEKHPAIRSFWGTGWPALQQFLNTLPAGIYTLSNKFKIITAPTSGESVTHGSLYVTAMIDGTVTPVNTYRVVTDTSPTVGKIYQETTTFTITDEIAGNIHLCYLYCDSGSHSSSLNHGTYECYDVQIEVGNTATAYEPYAGHTYPITWESIAGTVYGGTLDVVSGALTVDKVLTTFDGTESGWSVMDGKTGKFDNANINVPTQYNYSSDILFNKYKTGVSYSQVLTGDYIAAVNQTRLLLADSRYTTVDEFKASLASEPLTVLLPLATPQTYQLTPTEVRTLLGDNTVYTDAGDVTVEYVADTKLYIDKRLNTTRMMIAGVETSFVATKNYAIGDFVIVNDTLYRITAVITSGETITPGTNASETTVAEQLIALYNA